MAELLELRDYQKEAVDFGCAFFEKASRGSRQILAGPTGCGKSFVEKAIKQRRGPGCWLITPRLEIARGILEKDGIDVASMADLVRACWKHHVVTPIRFRNALIREGLVVDEIIFDEGHHASARSWTEIQLLCGMPPALLLTATPYRGTARGTASFRKEWGLPHWMVTLKAAAQRGDISIPRCKILPLVDDDEVELTSSGEFDVAQVASAYGSRLEDLAQLSTQWVRDDATWDRATVYTFPSVALCRDFVIALAKRGMLATCVHAGTSYAERQASFELLTARCAALCQVAVLGEGVDLPVRRLVDAAPKMSPVAWMQQLGRATRPVLSGEAPPEYICTNRNLHRHAYLLEGLLPPSIVAEAAALFGGPGKRGGYRAMGMEAIGKFKATEVKCLDGNICLLYNLIDTSNNRMREYACLVHPAAADPVWAERIHTAKPDGSRDWGKWARAAAPTDLKGFGSQAPRDPTDKMMAWWQRSAESRGLDPAQKVSRKNFAVLPLLFDLGIRFRK